MFTKVAKYINKALSYPSNLLAALAMVAIVFAMLATIVDVLGRWLFHTPIPGAWDLVTVSFAIIVWGPMALAAIKGSHVALTTLVDKLPRSPRLVLDLIIAIVTSGVMGILGWRLLMFGIYLWGIKSWSGVLKIAYAPFVYFAAFACALMALVFLARVPEIVGKIRKEPEAVEKSQKEMDAVEKIEKMKGSSA
jgi:TRAP-type C4-dicarboxylate transport system permease small subunit